MRYNQQENWVSENIIKQVETDSFHIPMITIDPDNKEHLYMQGDNNHGQLVIFVFVQMNELTEIDINGDLILGNEGIIEQVDLGKFHSSVNTNDENGYHLYVWGANDFGQLGLGDIEHHDKPEEVFSQQMFKLKNKIIVLIFL